MRRTIIVCLLGFALLVIGAVGPEVASADRPITEPTGNVTVKRHFWPLFSYVIADKDSSKAKVNIVVARRGGAELARIDAGWQRTNRVVTVPMLLWRCDFRRGDYVWRVKAIDREGNPQQKAWPARLTVW